MRKGKQKEVGRNRGGTTDGDGWRSGSLSASVRGEQMLYWNWLQPRPGLRAQGGRKCGALSPVCPGGRHVYDDRTPAVSPMPSSQMPGSYCFSPFGCPARGWNTDRYLHWGHSNHSISFPDTETSLWRPEPPLANTSLSHLGHRGVCVQVWLAGVSNNTATKCRFI